LNEFLKRSITVRILELNEKRRKVVGSARVIIEEEKEALATGHGTAWKLEKYSKVL